ncbi:hypothetical protein SESBI_01670 [Sesbania bispinosa]|nr:hypothetical protein SESBI_01670 [Sesbania bispinosa]
MADAAFKALMDMDRQVDDDPYLNLDLSEEDEPTNQAGAGGGGKASQDEEVDPTSRINVGWAGQQMLQHASLVKHFKMMVLGKLKNASYECDRLRSAAKTSQETIEKLTLKVSEIEGKVEDKKIAKETVEKEKAEVEVKLKAAQNEIVALRKPVSTWQPEPSSSDKNSKIEYIKRPVQKASKIWQEEKKKLVEVAHSINRESFERAISQLRILNPGVNLVTKGASCDHVVDSGKICKIDPRTKDVICVATGVVVRKGVTQSTGSQSTGLAI